MIKSILFSSRYYSSKTIYVCVVLILIGFINPLKTQVNVEFEWYYETQKIAIGEEPFKTHTPDCLEFENLKCYISNVVLLSGNKIIYKEPNSYHLLDASQIKSLKFTLNLDSNLVYEAIQFNLGIDSLTNVSGALGGELDPGKGMYWAWQSGYINTKIEGSSKLCKSPHNEFQFHLGGYVYPCNNLQSVLLKTSKSRKPIIQIQLADWLKNLKLEAQNHIMSPSKNAVVLSENLSHCFSILKP